MSASTWHLLSIVGNFIALVCVALIGLGLLIAGIFVFRHFWRKKPVPPPVPQPPSASPPAVAATVALPKCPQCRQPLPENAPEGLCPACLARVALDTEPAAPGATLNVNPLAEAAPPPRIAPNPAQLAAQFPQLEIIELLGMGGMGMVYKASQRRVDRLVALKILPVESSRGPYFAERFEREAKALAKLNHPGIVTFYDFGQTSDYYYFIMEYVDGMNLRQLLQSQTIEPRQALELVMQICTALQFAHDEGVVHRDIKPENILLNKKGQVKIADFGLAKLLGTAPDTALTMSQAAMGTMNYMAPEQRQNAQGVDHRADIYSLGVVFYEMLTGEVPMGRFEPPSKRVHVDVRLDEVVLKALEREPARRYQHASEVKTGVEAITSAGPQATLLGASGANPSPPAPKPLGDFSPHSATEQPPAFRGQRTSGKQRWSQMTMRGWFGVFLCLNALIVAELRMNPGQQWGGEIWILPIVEFGLGCGLVVWGRAAWREKKLTRWEIRHARERGLWPPLGEDPTLEHVKRMVQAGETIMAVKLYRQIHGGSFADAKAAVEKLASGSAPPQDAKAQAAAAPPPVAVNADHFWRRLVLVVVLALIAIPTILALFVGLLVSMYDQRGAQANQIAAQHVDQEGWQLLQEGKFDDARKKFTQVVEQFPANVDGWNGLGWTWLHTEHPQVAETNFQKALSLDANCPGALNGLGQIYLSQRNYEAAEKDLLQAAPKESAAWYGLARLFLLEGKFDSAKEWAQKVVDSGQADDTARQMLKAAQEKHVGDELRRMIEPPPHGYNDTHSTNNR